MQYLDETLRDRGYEGLRLSSQVFEQKTHVSVAAAALWRGMREVYG